MEKKLRSLPRVINICNERERERVENIVSTQEQNNLSQFIEEVKVHKSKYSFSIWPIKLIILNLCVSEAFLNRENYIKI